MSSANEVSKMDKILDVSISPHVRNTVTVPKIMWGVTISLVPAALAGWWFFGLKALWVIFLCVATCVATEAIIQKLRGQEITVSDGSALLTGLLLAFNLPPNIPWYLPVSGSVVAIAIAKHAFGGLGFNVWNPALIGRAFLLASWPVAMTTWAKPVNNFFAVDTVTTASPLGLLKAGGLQKVLTEFGSPDNLYASLFWGNRAGCIGETSAFLLILGGLYLIYKGYISWHTPVTYIATVAVLTSVFGYPAKADPLFHILSGGLILGAFFMATDMVTAPLTPKGQVIFGLGAGFLTTIIRLFGGYPEGVCYSILLMNTLTPMIDKYTMPKKYGEVKKDEKK